MKRLLTGGLAATFCLLAGAAALPSSGLAMSQPSAKTQMNIDRCFRPSDIDRYKVSSDGAVYLRLLGGAYYQLSLRDPCPGLDMERAIVVQPRPGSSYACNGEDINILTQSPQVPSGRCNVQSFRKLSDAEVAALKDDQKP